MNATSHGLIKSKFVRNVAIVATGTAGAQVITMAFSPIITRLYGPMAFGMLGTFMAMVSVLAPIAALSYPTAIVLPKDDSDAKGIAYLSTYVSLGIAALVTLVLLVARDWLVELLSMQAISSFILLVPLVMLFSAWLQIAKQWLLRKKQFKVTAKVAVAQSFILNSAKIGIGWFNPVAAVLIVLATLGNALHAIMLAMGAKRTIAQEPRKKLTEKVPLRELAKRHRDFPMYRAPQVFINAASQSLPVLMLASFFGPASAGFYALGKTVLNIPATLISTSVGDVFYPHISEAAHRGENLTGLIVKATLALAAVGFVPFAFAVIFGPWLFGFAFGAEWVRAGEYAQWSALWLFFMFLNTPSVKVLPILSAQLFHLIFTIFTIIIRLAVLLIGYHFYEDDLAVIKLFGVSGALINITLILIILLKSYQFDKNLELR